MKNILGILLSVGIALSFISCASKETDPVKELFKNEKSLVPINTKELKEVK
ncbi:hypothetical protein T36_1304 [Helicobacter cinaedi]|uniref:hypothetical protein n=1 Tax=Helicobacter cinaedi TaxID=213 RepID=UPI001F1E9AEA|nr:hypothetical protein [Helicobacter cinaedi]BDB64847.1 hypothetical protein T36_1304 [Helicobacter cinaedi]